MSDRKYKIVYCAPALYSSGGVERVVSVKASFFAEQYGYDVTIIVTEGKGKTPYFPLSEQVKVINLGLDFEELWHQPFVRKVFLYLKKQRAYKKRLTAELMSLRPDITISVLRREINFITKIKDGSKKIGELHVNRSNYRNFIGQDSNFIKRLFSRYWMNNLVNHLKRLDRMIVLTETAQNDWPELSNVVLIPDPLPFKVKDVSSLSTKRVISIGRYAYEKGIDLLLKAWVKVQDKCKDWELDIYGMGDLEPYRQQIMDSGINECRCHLHESLKDVKTEYLNSSLFALPSRFEGFGLVIVEAMSCGLPVISFDCENGPRNIIIDGQNGFLVPPFNIDVYAERLLTLMQHEDLRQRMGLEAHQTSCQYQIEDIAMHWKALFDEVVNS